MLNFCYQILSLTYLHSQYYFNDKPVKLYCFKWVRIAAGNVRNVRGDQE